MSQLRRLLLSNVGYKSAYYPGNMLDFCNPDTKEPENTVICLSNQGGKTTLISLLFTNIEPSTRKFVQRLQKDDHRFEHYFYPTPGVVALELQTNQKDITGASLPLVIGQCVVVKNGEAQRLFFLFHSNEFIGIDDLPFIGAGEKSNPNDMAEFRKWIDKATELNNTLVTTEKHRAWKKHLDTAGVEHELLAKQIDFCRTEGGISEFASFKDEHNFLEQFFKLAMDEDTAKQAHETLQTAHQKYKEIPLLKKEKAIKENLLNGFNKIHPLAQTYEESSKEIQKSDKSITSLANDIYLKKTWLDKEFKEVSNRKDDTQRQWDIEKNKEEDIKKKIKQVELAILLEEEKQIVQDVITAQKKLNDANKKLNLSKAVIAFNEVKIIEARQAELEKQISSTNKDIGPLMESLKKLGSQLIEAYKEQSKQIQKNLDGVTQDVEDKDQEIEDKGNELSALDVQLRDKEGDSSRLDEWFKIYEDQLSALSSKGHLTSLDLKPLCVASGFEYWTKTEKELKISIKNIVDNLEKDHLLLDEYSDKRTSLNEEINELQFKLKSLNDDYQKVIKKKLELQTDPQLCKLIQMQSVDPDDISLKEKLEKEISSLRKTILNLENEINDLEDQERWLENDKLAKPDTDIEKAISWLEERDLKALYYPHYLASQNLPPQKAQELVESDPARFYGIQVDNLSKAKELMGKYNRETLGLSRPIIVSQACIQIEAEHEHIVLPVRNDAAYNKDAATELLIVIKEKLEHHRASIESYTNNLSLYEDSQVELNNYQVQYGVDWLKDTKKEIDDGQELKAIKEEKKISIEEKAGLLETKRHDSLEQLESQQDRSNQAHNHVLMIESFSEGYENHKKRRSKEKAETIKEIELSSQNISSLSDELKASKAKKSSLKKERRSLEDSISHNNEAASDITFKHESTGSHKKKINITSSLVKYKTRKEAYELRLNESGLSKLEGKLEEIGSEVKEKQLSFKHFKCSFSDDEIEKQRNNLHQAGVNLTKECSDNETVVLSCTSDLAGNKLLQEQKQNAVSGFKTKNSNVAYLEEDLGITTLKEKLNSYGNNVTDIGFKIESCRNLIVEYDNESQSLELERTKVEVFKESNDELFSTPSINTTPVLAKTIDLEKVFSEISVLRRGRNKLYLDRNAIKKDIERIREKEIYSIIRPPEVETILGGIAIDLRDLPIELFIRESEDNIKRFQDILNTVESKIETHKDQLEFIHSSFGRLLDNADEVLFSAFKARIPDDMLHYSNKPILKSRLKTKDRLKNIFSDQQRRSLYEEYLSRTVESGSFVEDGYKLAAKFIMSAYDECLGNVNTGREKGLGIKIIKPHDVTIDYIPVDKMVGSGGEGLTAGLLLYLVIANIRGNQIGQGSYNSKGSFLLLDNPFSKANKIDLIRPQTMLAKKLNIQLIFATGIEDLNALSEFEHIIKLRKDKVDRNTNRQYIEVDEQVFNRSPAPTDFVNINSADFSFNPIESRTSEISQ